MKKVIKVLDDYKQQIKDWLGLYYVQAIFVFLIPFEKDYTKMYI